MPQEQGLGPDEEASLTLPPEEPAQPGENRSVGWPAGWTCYLAPQNPDFVTEHDDFNGQFLPLVPADPEQLEQANEGLVEEGERHDPSWRTASLWRRSR